MSETIPDNVEGIDADLARLSSEAVSVDAGLNPVNTDQVAAQEQQAAQAQINEVQELTTVLQLASSLFFPLFPSLQKIYTPEACATLAGAMVPVMVRRGWSVAGMLAGWGEEITLAIVAIPLAMSTSQAIKADIAAAEAKDKAEKAKEVKEVEIVKPEDVPESPIPQADEVQVMARG